jgi:hypothetical protein
MRRAHQAEIMRNKSGRVSGARFCAEHPYGNLPRLARSPQETTRQCFEPIS